MALLMPPAQNTVMPSSVLTRSTSLHALPALSERDDLGGAILPVIETLLQAVASVDKITRAHIETALFQLAVSYKSPLVLQTLSQSLLNDNQVIAGTSAMALIRVGGAAKPFVEALPEHWSTSFVLQELP
ncbi:MAG: hypothetical protein VKK59_04400 [Vampirovibrionales bacterium]|nr:hypothetical protein [Vampirovibrionales bacterium]